MKRMNVGKRVKKLLGQDMNLDTIAKIVNRNRTNTLTPKQCLDKYYTYIGKVNPTARASAELDKLIEQKEQIHLFGTTGSGKTYLVERLADLLNMTLVKSSARKEEDLMSDWGNMPFKKEDARLLFVLEGDGFYWKKYGLIRKYIQNSNYPMIIITTDKDTPTKHITKHLKSVKKFPPRPHEVADYFSKYDGENYTKDDAFIKKIYDKDWRKVWRQYKFGTEQYTKRKEVEQISSKRFSYLLLSGKATKKDYDRCEHPLSFILNWLGHNCKKFYSDSHDYHRAMSVINFVDKYKYDMKQEYLPNVLIEEFPEADLKAYLTFPPFQRIPEEDTNKDVYTVSKETREISNTKIKEAKEELGDFLLV